MASTSGQRTEAGRIETRLFIDGEFVNAKSGNVFDVVNPFTQETVASVQEADKEDIDKAVAAAKAAHPAWAALGAGARGKYLFKLADALDKYVKDASYLDAISMGKPAGADTSSQFGVEMLRYFAGKAYDSQGDSSLSTPGFTNFTFREPYGVTAGIIPWNGPFVLLVAKLGPSLVTGNTIVIKSSEKAPLSVLLIAKAAQEIGLPKGVFNLVSGFGLPAGDALARHMDVRKISFTGSTATGRAIKRAAAESNLKDVTLELGGKSPLIIFPDADLDKAVPAAAYSILWNSGQVCVASSRVYVHEDVAESFVQGMKEAFSHQSQIANPVSSTGSVGPVADKLQYNRVASFLSGAQEQGLELAPQFKGSNGHGPLVIPPTIILGAPEDSQVMKQEIFGPVVCINTFKDEAEVLKLANNTEYGLYASAFTNDISRGMRLARALEAGTVGINCTSPTLALDMPAGGYKGSGEGRELSRYALDAWTQLKTVLIAQNS